MKKTPLLLFSLLLWGFGSFSQTSKLDSLFVNGDSTKVMDSLMQDFDAFLDSATATKSFFSFNMGIGNRTFSVNNNSLNTQATATRLSYTPSVGYYHKSGLGLSATAFLSSLNNKLQFYQYAITPSFDYFSEKFSTGISYTRYLDKDTAIASVSPYINDIYGYAYLKKKKWRYGIALGYANGSFSDRISYKDSVRVFDTTINRLVWRGYLATINSNNRIYDLSVSASLRKEFEWFDLLKKNDNLSFTITAYLVMGASRINTNSNISYVTRKLDLSRFKRTFDTRDGTGFQLQSTALSFSLFYTIGKFNIQPVWFMDYYFPETDKKLSQVFSVALGVNF
jgi:hypothetical protein